MLPLLMMSAWSLSQTFHSPSENLVILTSVLGIGIGLGGALALAFLNIANAKKLRLQKENQELSNTPAGDLFEVDFKLYTYRQFFKTCPVPAIIVGQDGHIITANENAAVALSHKSENAMYGLDITDLFPQWDEVQATGGMVDTVAFMKGVEDPIRMDLMVRDVSCYSASGERFTATAGIVRNS